MAGKFLPAINFLRLIFEKINDKFKKEKNSHEFFLFFKQKQTQQLEVYMVNTAVLQRFVGGQFHTINCDETYRGEIGSIEVRDDILYVTFNWLAKRGINSWITDRNSTYIVSLGIFEIKDLGLDDGEEICLYSKILSEFLILFPPTSCFILSHEEIIGVNI